VGCKYSVIQCGLVVQHWNDVVTVATVVEWVCLLQNAWSSKCE